SPVLAFRHTISTVPLPFKSPVPAISHCVVVLPGNPTEETVKPFISHTATWPLVVFRQIRSALPSAFTSPMAAIFQSEEITEVNPEAKIFEPLKNQRATAPDVVSRQTRSAMPSPFTSEEIRVGASAVFKYTAVVPPRICGITRSGR